VWGYTETSMGLESLEVNFMIKVNDKVMVRDNWIEADYMVPPGTVVEIGYHKNSNHPIVFLVQFDNFKSHWFHTMALKVE
jgi:hypothetical protein